SPWVPRRDAAGHGPAADLRPRRLSAHGLGKDRPKGARRGMPALGAELTALLAAQEGYERRRTVWTRQAGRQLCDLSYANPQEGPHAAVIAAIRDALDSRRGLHFQYTPYGGATIQRLLVD